MNPMRYIDLFAGIGGFRFAAERAFKKRAINGACVFSCEIDPHAQASYYANFGETPFSDIAAVNAEAVPDHDVLFAGFPCQPFSIIGEGKGFNDTRGTLFFDIARILTAKRPKAFVLENVRRLLSHEKGNTLRTITRTLTDIGYTIDYRVLNALDYGLPQKRERLIIVGALPPFTFVWPERKNAYTPLSEILEREVDKKYYASKEIIAKRHARHSSEYPLAIWHENKSGHIGSYPYSCALRASASHNYLLVNGERRLTPRELLRLQGFPDSFKIVLSDSHIRKQAGNAVPVPMIEAVCDALMPTLLTHRSETNFGRAQQRAASVS